MHDRRTAEVRYRLPHEPSVRTLEHLAPHKRRFSNFLREGRTRLSTDSQFTRLNPSEIEPSQILSQENHSPRLNKFSSLHPVQVNT